MAQTHHLVNNTADIPSDYYLLTRRVLETRDPFNPRFGAELTQHEQINFDDFMTGGREGDIHEFWRQDQFMTNCIMQIRSDMTYTKLPLCDVTYKRITPALRLATIMMERNMDLWLLVMYATEKYDYVKLDRWLDEANFNVKHYHRTDFTTVVLPEMMSMTLIGYDKTCAPHEFGTTAAIWASLPTEPIDLRIGVGCSTSVWEPFTSTHRHWHNTSHEEKCRAWVHLAVTLVHEFAHTLQMYRDRSFLRERAQATNNSPRANLEPRVSLHKKAELGHAFEIKTFGGIMDMPEERHAWRKCSRPTIFTYDNMLDIPQIMTVSLQGSFTESADISPDTIVHLMQESTWANNRALNLYLWRHR